MAFLNKSLFVSTVLEIHALGQNICPEVKYRQKITMHSFSLIKPSIKFEPEIP